MAINDTLANEPAAKLDVARATISISIALTLLHDTIEKLTKDADPATRATLKSASDQIKIVDDLFDELVGWTDSDE